MCWNVKRWQNDVEVTGLLQKLEMLADEGNHDELAHYNRIYETVMVIIFRLMAK